MRHLIAAASAAIVLAFAGPTAAANLFEDGDFQRGHPAFTSSFEYHPGEVGWLNTLDLVLNPADAYAPVFDSFGDHTTGTGLMMIAFGEGMAWSQTVDVTPNTIYTLSYAWARLMDYADPQLSWSVTPGGSLRLIGEAASSAPWQVRTYRWNSGSLTQATFDLVSAPGRQGPYSDFPYFALDDIVLQASAVPEPATWAMMITGFGLAGSTLRKRRAIGVVA